MSLLFNQTCLDERLLPNHTHTHIYIYIHLHTPFVQKVLSLAQILDLSCTSSLYGCEACNTN